MIATNKINQAVTEMPPVFITKKERREVITRALKFDGPYAEWRTAIGKKTILKNLLDAARWTIPQDVFNSIEENDSFEMWDTELNFVGADPLLFHITSWTMHDLLETSWQYLFKRDEKFTHKIIASMMLAKQSSKPIYGVCEEHEVEELKENPITVLVSVKTVTPAYDSEGSLAGFVAFTTLRVRTS